MAAGTAEGGASPGAKREPRAGQTADAGSTPHAEGAVKKAGGGGGNRTPVRDSVPPASTRVFCLWVSRHRPPTDRLSAPPAATLGSHPAARLPGFGASLLSPPSSPSRRQREDVAAYQAARANFSSAVWFSRIFSEANRGPRRATEVPGYHVETYRPQCGSILPHPRQKNKSRFCTRGTEEAHGIPLARIRCLGMRG